MTGVLRLLVAVGALGVTLSVLTHGGPPAEPAPALQLIADAPAPYEPPSLTAAIPVDAPDFALGGGSFDLSAHPEKQEIRVSLVLGAPVARERWSSCRELHLSIDGRESRLPTHYTSVPMRGGVYDAVSVDLTIDHVRAMSTAATVEARLCGDVVLLSADRLPPLRDFVHRFEDMATYDGPPAPAPPPEFDPENPEALPDPHLLPVSA